jgi:hypothetical protein
MKIKCAMRNNESSSKINLRDVSWWMFIKDAYKLGAPIIARFYFLSCISLVARGRPSYTTHKQD